jgi:hypothetical protein
VVNDFANCTTTWLGVVPQFELALKGHGFSRAVRVMFSSRL